MAFRLLRAHRSVARAVVPRRFVSSNDNKTPPPAPLPPVDAEAEKRRAAEIARQKEAEALASFFMATLFGSVVLVKLKDAWDENKKK